MPHTIRFDPAGFASAVETSHRAGSSMSATVSGIAETMASLAGTIGRGPACEPVSFAADGSTQDVLAAALKLGPAIQNFASLLDAARGNHAASDAASDLAGGASVDATGGAGLAPASCPTGYVPSTAGGSGPLPWWWHYLARHLDGVVWPHVDVPAVGAAGAGLRAAAGQMSAHCSSARSGYSSLARSDSPDVELARNAATRLVGLGGDVVDAVRALGTSLGIYAAHVQAAYSDCEMVASNTLSSLQFVDVPGKGECLAAAGQWTTDTVGQGIAAADAALAAAAGKIKARLAVLARQAAGDATGLTSVGARALDATDALDPFVSARPVATMTTQVQETSVVPAPLVRAGIVGLEEGLAMLGVTGAEWLDGLAGPSTIEMDVPTGVGAAMAIGGLGVLAKEAADGRRPAAEVEDELSDEDKEALAKAREYVAQGMSAKNAARKAGLSEEQKARLKGLDLGNGRDVSGKYTGADVAAKNAEAEAVARYAGKTDNYVEPRQVRTEIEGEGGEEFGHRYYDAIEVLKEDPAHPGEYLGKGLEHKSGDATKSGHQQDFDGAIDRGGRVGRTRLPDGRIVRIIETDLIP